MKVYNFDLLAYPEPPRMSPVHRSELLLRPAGGLAELPGAPERDGLLRGAGVRGRRLQRAPLQRLRHHAVPQPHRRGPEPEEPSTSRSACSATSAVAPAPRARGRRVRHDRLPVRGPPDRRLRPRHSLGVPLVQRQAPGVARTVRGSVRRYHESLDRAGMELRGRVLPVRELRHLAAPVQQPHPPIWVAARSAESIEWCVKRQVPIAQVYQTTDQIEDTFNYYRKVAKEDGWESSPDKFVLCRHIYVGETDEQARAVAEPPLRYFFTLWNRGFNEAKTEIAVDSGRSRKPWSAPGPPATSVPATRNGLISTP